MLAELIPAGWRKPIYAIFGFIGLALGATEAWYAALPQEGPEWIGAALAAYALVGTGIGYVAQRNTAGRPDRDGRHEA